MLREDREFAAPAAKISTLAKDITEYLAGIDLKRSGQNSDMVIAIIRPVRCSTDRKSRKLRKNCFPRTDSW